MEIALCRDALYLFLHLIYRLRDRSILREPQLKG